MDTVGRHAPSHAPVGHCRDANHLFFEDFFDLDLPFPFFCFFGFACFSLLLYTCFLLWLLISTRDQNEYPKTSFSHFLKYEENRESHVFTIDITNALKKTFTIVNF